MLRIRLQRIGKRKDPKFRIILINSKKSAKSGSFLEILGSYDPNKKSLSVKKERIESLKKEGAVLSESVYKLYKQSKKD